MKPRESDIVLIEFLFYPNKLKNKAHSKVWSSNNLD